nr:hypothetical protein [uncultured Acetobacter sp.]
MVKHLVAGSVRNAVLNRNGLACQLKHELRQDFKGRLRTINNAPPLIYKPAGSSAPDMVSAYDEWSAGCRRNKAAADKLALHAMVHFPSQLIPLNGTPEQIAKTEQLMLTHAVRFINERNGGDAVFWARLDRDEEGRHNVDVFYAPRYVKHTKSKGAERWISLTKFDKEKALERYAQVPKLDVRKDAKGRKTVTPAQDKDGKQIMIPATSLFWRGKALQTDFYEYLRDVAKIRGVQRGEEKHTHGKDWKSVEDYKASKELEKVKCKLEGTKRQLAIQTPIAERQNREIKAFKASFWGFTAQAKHMDIDAATKAGKEAEYNRLRKYYAPIVAENKAQKTTILGLKADLNGRKTQIATLNSNLLASQYTASAMDVLLSEAIPLLPVPLAAVIREILEEQKIGDKALEAAKKHVPVAGVSTDVPIFVWDDAATKTLKKAIKQENETNARNTGQTGPQNP